MDSNSKPVICSCLPTEEDEIERINCWQNFFTRVIKNERFNEVNVAEIRSDSDNTSTHESESDISETTSDECDISNSHNCITNNLGEINRLRALDVCSKDNLLSTDESTHQCKGVKEINNKSPSNKCREHKYLSYPHIQQSRFLKNTESQPWPVSTSNCMDNEYRPNACRATFDYDIANAMMEGLKLSMLFNNGLNIIQMMKDNAVEGGTKSPKPKDNNKQKHNSETRQKTLKTKRYLNLKRQSAMQHFNSPLNGSHNNHRLNSKRKSETSVRPTHAEASCGPSQASIGSEKTKSLTKTTTWDSILKQPAIYAKYSYVDDLQYFNLEHAKNTAIKLKRINIDIANLSKNCLNRNSETAKRTLTHKQRS